MSRNRAHSRIENVLDILGTIRRLEKQQQAEADPRVRAEIAETLDLLNPSLDVELDQLARELKQEAA